ncbi:MAG: extracellular solute-binding protein [Micromonosporaceae bacterium]
MRPRFLAKRSLPLLAAAAVLAPLTACGSGSSSGSSGGVLHVYVYNDTSTKVQDAAAKEFNKTSKVKVQLIKVPGTNYSDKLRAVMGTPNAPDIFFNWGGASIKPYVDAGRLLDLTPTLNSDSSFKNAFIPAVLDAGKINGKYYGIPMRGTQPVILFYNKTMFDRYGLKPPATWNDLLKLVSVFKSHGIVPFALGGADAWTEQMWLEILLDRIGGPQVFARIQGGDKAGWSDPAMLKAAQYTRQLVQMGVFGDHYKSTGYVNSQAPKLFGSGKAAMHLMGSWEYSTQLANFPSFAKQGLAWAPFPTMPGGVGNPADVVGNPANYWSVNSHTKYKAAAIAFLKLMSTEFYDNQLVNDGEVPATSNAQNLLSKLPSPEYATFEYNMVKSAPSFTLSWDQALESQIATPMTTNIQKMFNGQLTPQQFVAAMKAL